MKNKNIKRGTCEENDEDKKIKKTHFPSMLDSSHPIPSFQSIIHKPNQTTNQTNTQPSPACQIKIQIKIHKLSYWLNETKEKKNKVKSRKKKKKYIIQALEYAMPCHAHWTL